jgi:hypothetical protein
MLIRTFAIAFAFLACATLDACSAHRRGGAANQNPDLITRQQLTENRFVYAYEAVQAMRGNWLQTHGTDSFNSPSEVLVYLDNVKLGGINELRSILVTNIAFVRHFDGLEATSRWGVGHAAGVIQVSSFTESRR